MPSKRIELQFPLKGLDEAQAFVRQRGGQSGTHTTAKCENVVAFDPATGRNRGAARPGITKYCASRIEGSSPGQCLVHVVGNAEDNARVTGTNSSPSRDVRITSSGEVLVLGPNSTVATGQRTTTLVGVAGGTIGVITPSGVQTVISGENALSSTPKVIFAEAFFQDVFFCDGANYKYYDVSSNQVLDWVAKNGGTMPSRASSVKQVSNTTNDTPITVVILSHGFLEGDQVTISGVVGNSAANGTWLIENVTQDTFELVGSSGNLPYISGGSCSRVSGSRCSLIAVWGGRIVMSGLATDPNNIFMSAVGDAFNWDYSPEVQTVQQAVAGNVTSGYGKNPDIVTALIPYTDDKLLIGGTHSIRMFLGNPAEGGINVSVTDITGVAFGKAWCQSAEGVIYFFGSRGGIYRISPDSGLPTRLTAMSIDESLSDIDLQNTIVNLEWDDRAMAVRVYLTPTNGGTARHFVWDVRNEAWWPFTYSNASHNPFAVHTLSGATSADRYILEYGQDGYIRKVDVDSPTDDGSPIQSHVYIGPFSGWMIKELVGTLSESSGNVTWAVCTASSLEKSLEVPPRASGRFRSGNNASQWPRVFIENGYLRLSATGPWALEKLTATVEQVNEYASRTMGTAS